ncbi:hypothetical protein HanIR_Chr11g0521291 [Helianthus annuus]|nr:hypothetical protein HanIR_Chr11g0521291 [Helianthus annuus]
MIRVFANVIRALRILAKDSGFICHPYDIDFQPNYFTIYYIF